MGVQEWSRRWAVGLPKGENKRGRQDMREMWDLTLIERGSANTFEALYFCIQEIEGGGRLFICTCLSCATFDYQEV